jgi:hypothetical protein
MKASVIILEISEKLKILSSIIIELEKENKELKKQVETNAREFEGCVYVPEFMLNNLRDESSRDL